MENFTPVTASIGGLLIGSAALLLYVFNGRIAGISGILNGLLYAPRADWAWRLCFLIGLLLGSAAYVYWQGSAALVSVELPLPLILLGGFLVGFGTHRGNGCTSGHGVCGISRLSRRSLVATAVFLLAGMATASLFTAPSLGL